MIPPMSPSANPATTARPRYLSLAAITAANAEEISKVKLSAEDNPTMGATSTPVNPARKVVPAQTPIDTRPGFVPDSEVSAGESTIARIARPASVKRSIAPPTTTTEATQSKTMT